MAELTLFWPSGPCRRRKIGETLVSFDAPVWIGPGPEPARPLQILEHYALPEKEEESLRAMAQVFDEPPFRLPFWIFEREGAMEKPVHNFAALYKRLMEERPDDFVSKYGFLWSRGESETVRDFFTARRELRKLVAFKKGDDWDAAKKWQEEHPQFMELDGVIGEDEAGRPQYEYQPRHLCGFIVAQLIQDWSKGKTYKFCKNPGC